MNLDSQQTRQIGGESERTVGSKRRQCLITTDTQTNMAFFTQ